MRQSQSLVFQAGFPCRPEVPQDVQRISHNPNPRAEPASYAALSPDYNPSDVRTQSWAYFSDMQIMLECLYRI